MKPLIRVPAGDVPAFTAQLRDALFFDEAALAVLPVAGTAEPTADEHVAAFVPDDVALVVETSGSTDAPKRVMLTSAALRASAGATERWFGGSPGQWLLALPATYIAGVQVLVRSLVGGTTPAVMPQGGFTPDAFVEAARTMDPDLPWLTSLVPVQLARLVEAAADDRSVRAALGSFERILLGGQAAPAGLVERAADLGARVHRTYGSSETAGGCVYDGHALPGVGVRVVDGEVQLSGPMLASGYLDDPERTAAAFTTDGDGTRWYRTGDLGELVPDAESPGDRAFERLRITGRADDVIISGGVKVALGEVERAVRSVAGYAGAVVLAVADPEWGERPAVVVERADAAASVIPDELALLAAATDAAGLPPAGRPVRVLVLERMPLLASGKPDRRALAELVPG
ncbi:O-succinylbenzoic acid--CoA ligase [Agromyces sp. CF514]|uniref:AMP-binding protein n=1 Tax=Agromyces sp. CF514 TaxID=1881031 RepID=UPI0008E251BA|nr:AMP-binding protein [Agromyces sp. CF514]SFR69074.1 O-succinylbenzoic acid--CoA ligase [Agromyces sp. CF514]